MSEISDKESFEKYAYFAQNPDDAEHFATLVYSTIIHQGDTVIDVGASRGLHTLPFLQLVTTPVGGGRVYAFEAIPEYAAELENKLRADNLVVVNAAVADSETINGRETISFTYVTDASWFSGIRRRVNVLDEWNPQEITVKATTLDESIPTTANVTFIKIDVEGAELYVLRGARRILSSQKPVLFFEFGRQYSADLYGFTKDDFFGIFDELEYQMFTIDGERFTRDKWEAPHIYWNLWFVHNDSCYRNFFELNLRIMALHFCRHQQKIKAELEAIKTC